MVAAFSPVALDSATLVEALERLVERFGRETGLATRLDTAALGDGGAASSAAARRSCCCAGRRRRWRTCAGTPRRRRWCCG